MAGGNDTFYVGLLKSVAFVLYLFYIWDRRVKPASPRAARIGSISMNSPEAVALSLLEKIREREEPTQRNEPPAARMIELYVQCLAAVTGKHQPPMVLH
jgi:hypothetical protein